jgi:hypothetical protein
MGNLQLSEFRFEKRREQHQRIIQHIAVAVVVLGVVKEIPRLLRQFRTAFQRALQNGCEFKEY